MNSPIRAWEWRFWQLWTLTMPVLLVLQVVDLIWGRG